MATWNTDFNEKPAGSRRASFGDDDIREFKQAVFERLGKELVMNLSSGLATEDGWARSGAGRAYVTTSMPTTKPDGSTPLDSNDDGRLWLDYSNDQVYIYRHDAGATTADRWLESYNWTEAQIQDAVRLNGLTYTGNNIFSGDTKLDGGVSSDTTFSGNNQFTGENNFTQPVDAPSVNTGQGDNEVYAMDQDVTSTSEPTFRRINIDTATLTNIASGGGVGQYNIDIVASPSVGGALRSYHIIIEAYEDSAEFLMRGTSIILISDVQNLFTTSQGTASSYNVYIDIFNSGPDTIWRLNFENQRGTTTNVNIKIYQ